MADITAHPDDKGKLVVKLTQASGAPTTVFDQGRGVTYTSSHPDAVGVADEDKNPLDADIVFGPSLTPEGEDATISVVLDGDPTEAENILSWISQTIAVVDGPATGGSIEIQLMPAEQPPEPAVA